MARRNPPKNPRNKKGQITPCPMCGNPVVGPAVYDSDACKQRAYRIRKEAEAQKSGDVGAWPDELPPMPSSE